MLNVNARHKERAGVWDTYALRQEAVSLSGTCALRPGSEHQPKELGCLGKKIIAARLKLYESYRFKLWDAGYSITWPLYQIQLKRMEDSF